VVGVLVAYDDRVAWIRAAWGAGTRGEEFVELALEQAVVGVAGLGGWIHVVDGHRMWLVASVGVPRSALRGRDGVPVRDGVPEGTAALGGRGVFADRLGWAGRAHVAVVPLSAEGAVVGVLSVLVGEAGAGAGQWGAAERAFLDEVARWLARGLTGVPQVPGPAARPLDSAPTRSERDTVADAVQHMTDGFVVADEDGCVTYVNDQAQEALGTSRAELLGRLVWEVLKGEDGDELRDRVRRAAEGEAPGFDVLYPAQGRTYQVRVVPGPGGLALSFRDTTERERRQAVIERAERVAAHRTARIEELMISLAEALTVRDVVGAVADRVLNPFRAEGMVIQVLDGDRLRISGAVGYGDDFMQAFGDYPIQKEPVSDVLRTRRPMFLSTARDYLRRYPHLADRVRLTGKHAWAFLPLIASGRLIGCCTISFVRPRELDDEERTLLAALSGVVAQALERARLYDAEHARVHELQRGLLPRVLPTLPAVTASARYLPASEGMLVGGDWYDVIPLSSERVALVIGDVIGHGLSEAVIMGRLRTAVQTLADLELPPDDLLAELNDLVTQLGEEAYATCVYTVYDPTTRVAQFARAGHPPVALLRPDGTVDFPDLPANPPLGVASPPFQTAELRLEEGTTLVYYTDGLVETRSRDVDAGIALLGETLAAAHAGRPGTAEPLATVEPPPPAGQPHAEQSPPAGQPGAAERAGGPGILLQAVHPEGVERPRATERPVTGPPAAGPPEVAAHPVTQDATADELDALCTTLTRTLTPAGAIDDDAALLVVRTAALPRDAIAGWDLPAEPVAAPQARALASEQLRIWGLEELVDVTELLVSELVGNAVRHARGPVRLRLLFSRALVCEVADGSATTPRVRNPSETDEGGRGLALVTLLSHRWGTRYTAHGKTIWTEQLLPHDLASRLDADGRPGQPGGPAG
jgi:PAS domain S-box-containing protein